MPRKVIPKPIYRTRCETADTAWLVEVASVLSGPWRLMAACPEMDDATLIIDALSRFGG